MKNTEQTEIESILKRYFSSCTEIDWDPHGDGNDSKNHFRILISGFKFEELQSVVEQLQNWNIYIKAYLNDVGIECERKT